MLRACSRLSNGFLRTMRAEAPGIDAPFQLTQAFSSQAPLDDQTRDRITGYVKSSDVVVFMKGTKVQPMCGFSMNVKRILDVHGVDFKDYNVLEDEKLREGIKTYSDWPTIPQVYVKGEFVGGSDILISLHKDGEITDLFDKNKISSRFSTVFPIKSEKDD